MTRRTALSSLQPGACTNLALWLDRYATAHKQEPLRDHHRTAVARISAPEGYERAFEARIHALRALTGGFAGGVTRVYDLRLSGRCVVGIGAASVRETALSLLRPWGVPFIPGSAMKGLASHVAHEAGGDWARSAAPGDDAGRLHRLVFGDVRSAGAVVFHDAWWVPGSSSALVSADTMTVHHAEYYRSVAPPADTDEPTPVSFLTATGRFCFALSGPEQAVELVGDLLARGLAERGIGAKTAAGYGRGTLEPRMTNEEEGIERWKREIDAIPGQAVHNGTAPAAVRKLQSARDAGVALGYVRGVVQRMWREKYRSFWEGWKPPTDLEPLWMELSPRVDTGEPAPAEWVTAEAWLDGKKIQLRLGGANMFAQVQAVNPDVATLAALGRASESEPIGVEIQIRSKRRVTGLRLKDER